MFHLKQDARLTLEEAPDADSIPYRLRSDASTGKAAGATIYCPDTGRFLFVKRSSTGDAPNVWACLGGGIDPGETIMQALKREFMEEGQVDTDNFTFHPFYRFDSPGFSYYNFIGVCHEEFEPVLNHEHTEFVWSERPPMPLHPNFEKALRDPRFRQVLDQARAEYLEEDFGIKHDYVSADQELRAEFYDSPQGRYYATIGENTQNPDYTQGMIGGVGHLPVTAVKFSKLYDKVDPSVLQKIYLANVGNRSIKDRIPVGVADLYLARTKADRSGATQFLVMGDIEADLADGTCVGQYTLTATKWKGVFVPHASLIPKAQGKGYSSAIYNWWLKTGLCLLMSSTQSKRANFIWKSLAKKWPWFLVRPTYDELGEHPKKLEFVGQSTANTEDVVAVLLGKGWTLSKFAAVTKMQTSRQVKSSSGPGGRLTDGDNLGWESDTGNMVSSFGFGGGPAGQVHELGANDLNDGNGHIHIHLHLSDPRFSRTPPNGYMASTPTQVESGPTDLEAGPTFEAFKGWAKNKQQEYLKEHPDSSFAKQALHVGFGKSNSRKKFDQGVNEAKEIMKHLRKEKDPEVRKELEQRVENIHKEIGKRSELDSLPRRVKALKILHKKWKELAVQEKAILKKLRKKWFGAVKSPTLRQSLKKKADAIGEQMDAIGDKISILRGNN